MPRPRPSTVAATGVFVVAAVLYGTIGVDRVEAPGTSAIPVYVVTTTSTAPASPTTTSPDASDPSTTTSATPDSPTASTTVPTTVTTTAGSQATATTAGG